MHEQCHKKCHNNHILVTHTHILIHTISSRLTLTSSRRTMRKLATPSKEKNSCHDGTSARDAGKYCSPSSVQS